MNLPSARTYIQNCKCSFSEGEKARVFLHIFHSSMARRELCSVECGSCVSPRQGHFTSQGFSELEKQKVWKKLTNAFLFSNWLRRVPARLLTERTVLCSRKFGSSICASFVLFGFPKSSNCDVDIVKKEFYGALSGPSHILSQKLHWRRSSESRLPLMSLWVTWVPCSCGCSPLARRHPHAWPINPLLPLTRVCPTGGHTGYGVIEEETALTWLGIWTILLFSLLTMNLLGPSQETCHLTSINSQPHSPVLAKSMMSVGLSRAHIGELYHSAVPGGCMLEEHWDSECGRFGASFWVI